MTLLLSRGFAALSVFTLLSCSDEHTMPPKVVEVEKASFSSIKETTSLIGVVKAKNEAVLTTKTSGNVDFLVQAGDKVKKGDVLATIQNPQLPRNVELAQRTLEITKKQLDRSESLEKTKTIAKESLENKNVELFKAEKALSDAKTALENAQFIAPFDGVVGVFRAQEGAHLNVGDPLVSIYQPGNLVINVDIPERFVKDLSLDHKVIIDGKTFPFSGIQRMIDPETHMAPAYVNFGCENCVIGSNVIVELILNESEKAITLPFEAVNFEGDKPSVYIVKDDKADKQVVELGMREKDRVEIKSSLNEGDLVVVKGITRLYPTAAVTIKKD